MIGWVRDTRLALADPDVRTLRRAGAKGGPGPFEGWISAPGWDLRTGVERLVRAYNG